MRLAAVLACLCLAALPLRAAAADAPAPVLESKSRLDVDATVEALKKAATDAGWRVPAVHDLQESLRKAGKDVLPVRVVELCKPALAAGLLVRDDVRSASVLMPCRISVYRKADGSTYVSRMNSAALAAMFGPGAGETMKAAGDELEKLLAPLVAGK